MTEVTTRLRSIEELRQLLKAANRSPFIGYISIDELKTLIDGQTIRFIYVDHILAGFGGWIPINSDWIEIGPFFVSEQFQGQGLGKLIIHKVIKLCKKAAQNQYAVTRNPAVKHILQKQGFSNRTLVRLPLVLKWHVISKLNVRKIVQFLRKPLSEPVSHFLWIDTPT